MKTNVKKHTNVVVKIFTCVSCLATALSLEQKKISNKAKKRSTVQKKILKQFHQQDANTKKKSTLKRVLFCSKYRLSLLL
jgi:hypothetical protein